MGDLLSDPHEEQVDVAGEVGGAVEHQGLVDAVLLDIHAGRYFIIAQVEQVDLLIVQGQKGGQTVAVGVPDDQQLAPRGLGTVSYTHLPPVL